MRHIKPCGRIWIPVLALLLPGCTQNHTGSAPTAPKTVKLGEPVVLAPGESVTVGEDGLVLHFDRITGDSRCPEGVECFWQGDAAAALSATAPGLDSRSFTLHTYPGFQTFEDYGPYRITLVRVEPYPVYPQEIDPGDYRVTLNVTSVAR